jgi:5-methylcytosine-specific restriction endonuclease McrA
MKGNLLFSLEKPYQTHYVSCLSSDMEQIEFPEWQRYIIPSHVEDIVTYQESFLRTHQCFDFKDFIKLGFVGGRYYCVDGQHRLEAIKSLSKLYKPFNVLVQVIQYPSRDVMKQDFTLLHKSTPVSDYILEHGGQIKGQILKEVEQYFRTVYRNYVKDSARSQKPHIHLAHCLDDMSSRKWFAACSTSEEVIDYIEKQNKRLHELFEDDPELRRLDDKIDAKAIEGRCLYLCLDRQWYYDEEEPKTRVTTSPEQRKRVWELSDRTCYICRDSLSEKSFVSGHKRSVKNGGLTAVGNLVPMCVKCNSQLGSTNVD